MVYYCVGLNIETGLLHTILDFSYIIHPFTVCVLMSAVLVVTVGGGLWCVGDHSSSGNWEMLIALHSVV